MTTKFADHFIGPLDHADLPAVTTVPVGTIAMCSTHGKLEKSDGAAWVDWLVLPTFTTDPEVIRDTMGVALVNGPGVLITPNDAGDTITIAADPEFIRDTLGAALVAGSGGQVTVDDATNTITVGADSEYVRDVIGAALLAGSNVTITVNDAGDTITLASTGGGTGAALTVRDEGTALNTAVADIDFTGAGVNASFAAGKVTVDIPATGSGSSLLVPNSQAADYTLVAGDVGKVIEVTNAGPTTVTVPANTSVAFPVGTVINIYQAGAGAVSIGVAPGVTVRNLAPLAGQYAEASLRKRATDEWVLTGDLAASNVPLLKDYAEAVRTAGDISLTATSATAVSTPLDLTIAAAAGDLVAYGISGLLSNTAQSVTFDVYTMPNGSGGATANPFGPGLSATALNAQGVAAWEILSTNGAHANLSGEAPRVLTAGDVSGGLTTLRLMYVKGNTSARVLFAQTNIPLKVWAKNYGPA